MKTKYFKCEEHDWAFSSDLGDKCPMCQAARQERERITSALEYKAMFVLKPDSALSAGYYRAIMDIRENNFPTDDK